ncbi:hypothetical protein K474DRAFT_1711976 [Panus rudis PR-1116 ss-1]|nr:hypothetical protein K474DRAFT_1711976 [Panus rudis PR-1116 ss-1]
MLTHIRGFILYSVGAGVVALAVWVLTGIQQFAECFGFHGILVDTIQGLEDAKSDPRRRQEDDTDVYSIRQVNCKFHHLAPPGRENAILRKLVHLIAQLDLYNLILEWVAFMGGMNSIPTDLRPMIRMSIVAASSASDSTTSGWEERFRVVFADIADSTDLKSLLDIMKHLVSKYKTGHPDRSNAIGGLFTYAISCHHISIDDICSLIQCVGGIACIPHNALPHVRRHLAEHVTTRFYSMGSLWLRIVQILFEEAGASADDTRRDVLTSLLAKLDSPADIKSLILACNGMLRIPEDLRPRIRANLISISADPRDWTPHSDLIFDSLASEDAPTFHVLLRRALTSLKSHRWVSKGARRPGMSGPIPADHDGEYEVCRHTFMSSASRKAKLLVEWSSVVPTLISNRHDDILFLMTSLLPRRGGYNEFEIILSELPMCFFLLLHMDPEGIPSQYSAIKRYLVGWDEVLQIGMIQETLPDDDESHAHNDILLRKLGTEHPVLLTATDSLRDTLRQLQQRRPPSGPRSSGLS